MPEADTTPIAVDLDGTLIKTDLMVEACAWMWKHKPLRMLWLILAEGSMSRARFKWTLYSEVTFDPQPLNERLVVWLGERKKEGRKLILATAAPQFSAEAMARQMGDLFDEAVGSTREENRRYKKKARWLVGRFGEKKFDYIGNSQADIPVWQAARAAYNVNPSKRLKTEAKEAGLLLIQIAESAQAEAMEKWDDWLRTWKWLRWVLLIIAVIIVSCGGLRK